MRKAFVGLTVVAGLVLGAQAATAQKAAVKPISFGVQGDVATNHYGPGVGARVVYTALGSQLRVPGLQAYGSFDWFFPGSHWGTGLSFWEINANATYDIHLSGVTGAAPYIGGGLNYAHLSADCAPFDCSASETGLNLLGGIRFHLTPSLNAYAEARAELRSGSAVVFTGGILF
jgi:hypothetical protein